jgi:peptidyl-prolyl cis-trans isomerase SurA
MIRRAAMPPRSRVRVAAVLVLGLGVSRGGAEVVDRIVATIDGEPVTAHELRRYAKDRNTGTVPESQVLDALITDKLLEKEIKAQGIAARDDEIDRYLDEIQSRNGMDRGRFAKALDAQGITLETYRARVKAEIEKVQLVNREIRQRVNVSPEEIQRYYDAHLADYGVDERIRVQDILFAVGAGVDDAGVEHERLKAVEVRELALKGADFGELAKQFSEGPGADNDGELGTFAHGEMDGTLDEVAFALKPGEVSTPVRTSAGFHLLRVRERIASGHRPLKEVQDQIREALYNEALEQRFQDWLSRDLRERHHVEVLN